MRPDSAVHAHRPSTCASAAPVSGSQKVQGIGLMGPFLMHTGVHQRVRSARVYASSRRPASICASPRETTERLKDDRFHRSILFYRLRE